MGLKASVDELTKTIQEREEKRMLRRLEKWFKKLMNDTPPTPEQQAKQLQMQERLLMGLCL